MYTHKRKVCKLALLLALHYIQIPRRLETNINLRMLLKTICLATYMCTKRFSHAKPAAPLPLARQPGLQQAPF